MSITDWIIPVLNLVTIGCCIGTAWECVKTHRILTRINRARRMLDTGIADIDGTQPPAWRQNLARVTRRALMRLS